MRFERTMLVYCCGCSPEEDAAY
ncbi:MaoC family dehydratase, partial [Salmonella enterica subsp. enterica serovar Infantis]|nr:MaoC family dehydratase [Salmonella enterica subsp. enterica serovar Infantis]EIN4223827.1 MaoC family dehydratase [Salmonella enterica subsp. enterica serovar Infantis]